MTCADFQEQVMAWALGALDAADARDFETHLRENTSHPECVEAYERARATVQAMDDSLARVRPQVWERIESEAKGRERPRRRSAGWVVSGFLGLALAAALVLMVYTYNQRARLLDILAAETEAHRKADAALVAVQEARAACASEVELSQRLSELLETPGTRTVALAPPNEGSQRAVAIYNPTLRRAMVVSTTLTPMEGRDFQLWVLRKEGAPLSAGVMHRGGQWVVGEVDSALLDEPAAAFAVSLEPQGGSPEPTEVLIVGKV